LSSAGTVASLLVLGVLLGMKHALEADHIAAVAALATRSRTVRHTVLQGIFWGAGHTLTLLFFGGVVLAMHVTVPQRLAGFLELAVGVMLIALGLDVFRRLRKDRVHFHVHRHGDGVVHVHVHSHAHERAPHDPARHEHLHPERLPLRALFVGMIHGMAGTAALILVAIGSARSIALGLAEIVAFGAGSIAGMAVLSLAIAIPMRLSARLLGRAHDALQALAGAVSVGLGGTILYQATSQV
jgi:cytochrome c biogenesis protein CcdA